ncbi:hypothetical protein HPDFL43_14812 [Hoeflea phototrophica DFL-43]|jgi:hypothetical protein|uniref:Uncharacterized protein n=1 Tax=Hoeflea phototrophica (strain DSM 17068 / NCIMB 14078 / DFL-43) TaxID=411684 RepID=A9D2V0_HOEPD|nr:hypothetical protein [Hoeflea phototrophica]EDQ34278.1 hypothetical protein HPDFL43_14812 [Hoeflea phototrophica DFL-43]
MRKTAPKHASTGIIDLFRWRAASDIQARRRELARRIQTLKPNAWRRVELQAELRRLTTEALRLETRQ